MSRAPSLFLRQQPLDLSRQILPRIQIAEQALFVHQPHRWDAGDPEFFTEFILAAAFLEILRPSHAFLGERVQKLSPESLRRLLKLGDKIFKLVE